LASRKSEPNKPYVEMIGIFTISWLLVLLGAIIIFKYIVPFSYCNCSNDSILKGVFAVILSGAWLLAMVAMRDVMVRRTILRRKVETG
jgi:hypothetical protein